MNFKDRVNKYLNEVKNYDYDGYAGDDDTADHGIPDIEDDNEKLSKKKKNKKIKKPDAAAEFLKAHEQKVTKEPKEPSTPTKPHVVVKKDVNSLESFRESQVELFNQLSKLEKATFEMFYQKKPGFDFSDLEKSIYSSLGRRYLSNLKIFLNMRKKEVEKPVVQQKEQQTEPVSIETVKKWFIDLTSEKAWEVVEGRDKYWTKQLSRKPSSHEKTIEEEVNDKMKFLSSIIKKNKEKWDLFKTSEKVMFLINKEHRDSIIREWSEKKAEGNREVLNKNELVGNISIKETNDTGALYYFKHDKGKEDQFYSNNKKKFIPVIFEKRDNDFYIIFNKHRSLINNNGFINSSNQYGNGEEFSVKVDKELANKRLKLRLSTTMAKMEAK